VEIRFDVSTMLCHLAPRERDVVTRQLNGEKAREIAQALGLSEVNVRQLSFRAMRQLRKVLGKSIVGTILRQLP
jgi:RNA polymerase sigma factor (sigma-70 family)